MLIRRRQPMLPSQAHGRSRRRIPYDSSDQASEDFRHARSDTKSALIHSRSHSYDWSENSGFDHHGLTAQTPLPPNTTQSENSHILEQASVSDEWSHSGFEPEASIHDGCFRIPEYASSTDFFQAPFSGYSCMTDIDAKAYSTATSSILSSPVPVKADSYLTLSESNKTNYSTSPSSRTSLTLDNLDTPTRAAILDLVCKRKKQVTVHID